MKKIFILYFLCVSYVTLTAQNNSIKGVVLDEENKALPFVSVLLKNNADSVLYKGEITNESGEFIFQNVKGGDFYLETQFTGYIACIKKGINLNDSFQKIDLGEIKLTQKTKELQTITVEAEKPFMEKQADKTVVNIENSIIQKGSSIMEVLEKLPGILVDQDGNIRLRGKQGVIIMIDGKPSVLSGQDLANMLRGMSSSNIQKIEIITNPSSKWDAAGNAGIINIIMKKNKTEGYNGNASVNYGQGRYAKYNSSVSFNYKKNKVNLFFNYSYSNRKGFNNLLINRKFHEKDTLRTTYLTNNYLVLPFSTHTPRLGADFYASKKTTLSFLGAAVYNSFNPSTSNHTDILGQNNDKTSSYEFSQKADNKFYNYDFNLQLNHKFDSLGQELTINLDHANYWNNVNQLFSTLFKNEQSNLYTNYYLTGHQNGSLHLYSAKADYSKPFKNGLVFESGWKSSLVQSDQDMQFFNRVNDIEYFDTIRSSHFLYSENINAGYINFNKKFKKITLQTGLRAEHTLARGKQLLNNQSFNRNYVQVFPTVYLDYHPSDKHNININLGRRINRPGYDQMNPFKRLIDFTTYSEGNPYLLPQLTYNSELGYSFKNTFFITLNYAHTTNNITDVLVQDAKNKTATQTVVNLNQLNYYSIDISYSKRITKWWKTNTNVLSYFAKFTGTINNYSINQGTPSFYVASNNSFSIKDGFTAECNLQYNHQNLYGVTLDKTTYNLTIGLQKNVLKKQGSITINCTDIFWKAFPRGITQFGDVTENWSSRRDTRVLNIGFSYKFGNGGSGKIRKSTGADDEKKRI